MTSQSGQTSFMPSSTAFSTSDEERHPLKESIATTTFFITYRFNSDKYIEKREVYVPLQSFFQEHFKRIGIMVQNQEQPVGRITFSILIALSLSHCLNDLLQSVISAAYPLFKDDLGLNFAQIGLITLVYQLSASVFQPITGIIFDKHPVAWSLPIGMSFTMIGMINLAFSNNLYWMLISVF